MNGLSTGYKHSYEQMVLKTILRFCVGKCQKMGESVYLCS